MEHELHQRLLPKEQNINDQTIACLTVSTDTFTSPSNSSTNGRRKRRFLDRSAPFNQSRGKMSITRNKLTDKVSYLRFYLLENAYHTILHTATWKIVLIMLAIYFSLIVFFAVVYWCVFKWGEKYIVKSLLSVFHQDSRNNMNIRESDMPESFCKLDLDSKMEALYLSLSTWCTLGYGVSDYYFGDCWLPFVLVVVQVFCSLIFNALAFGVIFQRISRGQNRAKTVIFSDKAVIRRVRGQLYFMFQVCELRKRQLFEAHVRVYCIRQDRELVQVQDYPFLSSNHKDHEILVDGQQLLHTTYFQTHNVRLQHPDDTTGAFLLMALPNVLVHKIDSWSPLMPPSVWYDRTGFRRTRTSTDEENIYKGFPDVLQRSCDHSCKTTNGFEVHNGVSVDSQLKEEEEIRSFISDREAELIVLVEGVDEMTGSTIQARHSYRYDDIVWHHGFVPCVSSLNDDEVCAVLDMTYFHDLTPVPMDSDSCPFIPSI